MPGFCLDHWEPFGICFYPHRCVAAGSALPGAEPDQHQFQSVVARFSDLHVHGRKVEVSFRRFDQFPGGSTDHGIKIHVGQVLPDGTHVLGARRA